MKLITESHNFFQSFFRNLRIALAGSEKNFTTGSIDRAIFLLSVPMILEMVMESLFAVVDVFFVSKIGINAVATVGLTESVITLVYSIAIGSSMATTAMIARRIGENRPEKAATAAVQAFYLAIAISGAIGIVGVIYAEEILVLMGSSDELVKNGSSYTRIMFGGNATILVLFLLNAVFRGAGDAAIAMRALWVANGINILLDPCLILGLGPFPELGLEGAAIATNIGRGVGVVYQLFYLFNGKSLIIIRWNNLGIRWNIILRLVKVGAGGAGQFLISSASWIFLVRVVSLFGSGALAGYTVAIRIIIFTILPSWGLSNAAATLVGQNLGADAPERAEISVWKCAFYNLVFLALVALVFGIWASPIVSIFSVDPTVNYYGSLCLRIVCFGYVFFAYGMVMVQAFNGAGDTRTPTIINLICYWAVQVPLAYTLAVWLDLGPYGVFLAIAIAESLLAVVSIIVFRRGKWKVTRI